MLYEIHDVRRFPKAGNFLSYARLVRCAHESAGKRLGSGGKKIGNAHLKWAFSEATVLLIRQLPEAKQHVEKLAKKHGKGKLTWPAGHTYEGEFANDYYHGHGKALNTDGTYYEGEFVDGAVKGKTTTQRIDGYITVEDYGQDGESTGG